jgi:hypothetical protein
MAVPGQLPRRSDINPLDLSQVWEDCFVLRLTMIDGLPSLMCEYIGVHLVESYGQDYSGQSAALDAIGRHSESLLGRVLQAVHTREPVMEEGQAAPRRAGTDNKERPVKYRLALFPLSEDGQHVTHVLGCIRWVGAAVAIPFRA